MDIDQLRDKIAENLKERAAKQAELDQTRADMKSVTDGAEQRGDGNLTADEVAKHTAARDKGTALQTEIRALDEARTEMEQRVDDWEASEAARAAAEKSAERFGGTQPTQVRVGAEESVYRKGGEHSFFADLYRYRFDGDPLAADRVLRHAKQAELEARDASTSSFAGLVIPQYLVNDFAPVARAGRPLADYIGARALPPVGMTLNVPRGATGTVIASQTTENLAVAEQDVVNEDIVVAVRTIAGQHDMSRQSIDRGVGTDQEVMSDLAEAYAAELDRQLITGTGANGQHLGILTTTNVSTITVTSTGAVTQIRQIADAAQRVHSNRFQAPTVIVVHPRRWAYWVQATDSSGRPLVTPSGHGPQNVWAAGDLTAPNGVVGDLYGIPVLVDANVPTTISTSTTQGSTEDRIIVTRATDLRLFEDDPMPRRVRFEETLAGNLTVKIVAWDYSAFTAARYPTASVVLAGTGLTTPVFG